MTLSELVSWSTLIGFIILISRAALIDPIKNELIRIGTKLDRIELEGKDRTERLVKVESSSKQAHKRIDSLEERLEHERR